MLLVSLLLSTVLLSVATNVARTSGRFGTPCLIAGAGTVFGWPCFLFPALSLTGLLMVLAGLLCHYRRWGPQPFQKCSLAALGASHVLVGALSFSVIKERMHLREQYPVESMAVRLAYEDRHAPRAAESSDPLFGPGPAAALTQRRLEQLEVQFGEPGMLRTHSLARLHDTVVVDFIDSPGFGITRRIEPRQSSIELPEAEPIPLPHPQDGPLRPEAGTALPRHLLPWRSGSAANEVLPAGEALIEMHQEGVLDFVHPKRFGHIRDREHVRGFQRHQFQSMPRLQEPGRETDRWLIQSLQLVSLLKHDEPAVYLSDHLPRMRDLQDATTRPLGAFEQRALELLRGGEDLEVQSSTHGIQMLGSIRAVRQCLRCHRVNRGELLGAFSYQLRRAQTAIDNSTP